MCWCTPEIRTPHCGRPECHPPTFTAPITAAHAAASDIAQAAREAETGYVTSEPERDEARDVAAKLLNSLDGYPTSELDNVTMSADLERIADVIVAERREHAKKFVDMSAAEGARTIERDFWRAALGKLRVAMEGFAEGDCHYGDGCPVGARHGRCVTCVAREALA